MNVLFPPSLTLTSTPLTWRGGLRMWFTVAKGFALTPAGSPKPANAADAAPFEADVSAADAWAAALSAGPAGVLDMGMPKVSGEWLLAGAACVPENRQNQQVTALTVDITVGSLSRSFLVTGPRTDTGEPQPFTQAQLDWKQTYGWPDSPDNPDGCGKIPDPRTGRVALPTVTELAQGPARPGLALSPACPQALGPWPCRQQHRGTYTHKWLTTRWPGMPDDFDWTYFNLAQPPQRLAPATFFQGGEAIRLTHLHPLAPTLEGTVPKVRLRVFVDRIAPAAEAAPASPAITSPAPAQAVDAPTGMTTHGKWEEMPMRYDTVWLFPNQQRGLCLWHGACTTVDEAGSDLAQVVVVLEDAGKAPQDAAGLLAASLAPPASAPHVAATVAPVVAAAAVVGGVATAKTHAQATSTAPPAASNATPPASNAPPAPPIPPAPPTTAGALRRAEPLSAFGSSTKEAFVRENMARLHEHKDEINAVLIEQGLPPLDAQMVQAIQAKTEDLSVQLAQLGAQLQQPAPELETLLAQGGLSPEKIAAIQTAIALTPPDPADFAGQAEYAKATQAHVAKLTKLLAFSEDQALLLSDSLLMQGPTPPSLLETQLGKRCARNPVFQPLLALLNPPPAPAAHGNRKAPTSTLAAGGAQLTQLLVLSGIPPLQAENINAALDVPPPDMDAFPTLGAYQKALEAYAAKQEVLMGFPRGSISNKISEIHKDIAEKGLLDPAMPIAPAGSTQAAAPKNTASAESVAPVAPVSPATTGRSAHENATLAAGLAAAAVGTVAAGAACAAAPTPATLFPLLTREDVEQALATGRPLAGETLAGLDLGGLCFAGVDLSRADCTGTRFCGADLHTARCIDTTFDKADLTGCLGVDSTATGARFVSARLTGSDFSNAQLNKACFDKADLVGCRFSKASLVDADFSNATATGADFSAANLSGSRIMGATDFSSALFVGATLSGASWEDLQGQGLDCRQVNAKDARFERCRFNGSRWSRASLRKTTFAGSWLQQANLERIDLLNGSLRGAHLGKATLREANLHGVDLYRAAVDADTDLEKADLSATCLGIEP